MKDLEIRGAGNLLGKMQHGHMEAVGYDLYCKMLNEAVKHLKGIDLREDFQTTIDLDINAFIPAEYILNEFQKLDIYKRIAAIENEEECDDMRKELSDRFGSLPKEVENLLQISLIRARAHRMYVEEIKGKKDGITIIMNVRADIKAENIPLVIEEMEGKLKFTLKNIPTFTYRLYPTGFDKKDEEMLLETAVRIIASMEKYLIPPVKRSKISELT